MSTWRLRREGRPMRSGWSWWLYVALMCMTSIWTAGFAYLASTATDEPAARDAATFGAVAFGLMMIYLVTGVFFGFLVLTRKERRP